MNYLRESDILECAQSVYDFLIDDTDIRLNLSFNSFNEVPAFKRMNEVLIRNGFGEKECADMILFTLVINSKWKIYDQEEFRILLRNNPKDFFSSTKSHDFYRTIIRDLKLNLCLS